MIYLDNFIIPIDKEEGIIIAKSVKNGGMLPYIDNVYPCGIFSANEFSRLDFQTVTILYGGNGSGKSTLLNLIADKLALKRIAPYNKSELFDMYVKACKFDTAYDDDGYKCEIPSGSRIITSDDIFDYMLTVRTNNEEIAEKSDEAHDKKWSELKFGDTIKMHGFEDYEALRLQVLARQKSLSRRKFIERTVGKEVKLCSNGETAIDYFNRNLQNDTLFCLDEPENSLSPKRQTELVEIIARKARYCGCQFIIATHSPFILALDGAKIYDLDCTPVDVKKWWELENTKAYFDFFKKNKSFFE